MSETKKKYVIKSDADIGVRDEKTSEVTMKHVLAGGEVELTEEQLPQYAHLLADPPEVTKVNGRELEDDELEALDSIRKRPDNLASGVLRPWETDSYATSVAESRAVTAELSATPKKRGATGDVADSAGALEHGFQRSAAGPGSTTDPSGFSGGGFVRPRANMTEMEKEDLPKMRAQEAKDLKLKREHASAMTGGAAKKPVEAPSRPTPAPGSPAAQNTK